MDDMNARRVDFLAIDQEQDVSSAGFADESLTKPEDWNEDWDTWDDMCTEVEVSAYHIAVSW